MIIYKKHTYYNLSNRFNTSYKFLFKHFLDHHIHLGGNYKSFNNQTSSIIYAKRVFQLIVNLNQTILVINKIGKVIEALAYKRGVIYMIHNALAFRSVARFLFNRTSFHLFHRKRKWIFKLVYVTSKWLPGFLLIINLFFLLSLLSLVCRILVLLVIVIIIYLLSKNLID